MNGAMAFRKMAGGARGLSPRGCETAAPWHKSRGHSFLEEQMFPIRVGMVARVLLCFSRPVFSPGPGSSVLRLKPLRVPGGSWGKPDLSPTLGL